MNVIALAGNPNVGKSVFFGWLTGRYAEVSNFPGTTVTLARGRWNGRLIVDTPGVYGVSGFTDEERAARDAILDADAIVNVVDALHLPRDLFLTQQLVDLGKRVVVCVNMMDEARRQRLQIDCDELSRLLGVPVVPTAARYGGNKSVVSRALDNACVGRPTPGLAPLLRTAPGATRADRLLLTEDDDATCKAYGVAPAGLRDRVYRMRRRHADALAARVTRREPDRSFAGRLGRLLLRPAFGLPAMTVTVALTLWFLGDVVARRAVAFTQGVVMDGLWSPFVRAAVSRVVSPDGWLGATLVGEYGLLTMTPSYLLGLLLPLVAGFYLTLSVLEDSGWLPRCAAMLDRALSAVGLNGRAVIPLLLGFGCVTAATVSTRSLGSRRERVIASALLGVAVPCSGQLGFIAGSAARLGPRYAFLYAAVVFAVFLAVGKGLDALLPGRSTDLLLDLPRLRPPQVANVLRKTVRRTVHFLAESLPVFAVGSVAVTFLTRTGALDRLAALAAPVIENWLRLPRETAPAFLMGALRRDFGAAGLYAIPMTNRQTLVAMVVMTLFVPCVASVLMLFRERSKTEATLIWFGSVAIALAVGGLLATVLSVFP